MKKIISFTLFLCLITSFSLTALAADTTIDTDSTNKNAETAVSANVSPTYTVTIPETVTLDETATIKAENVLTNADMAVKVAITGTDKTDNAFAVTTDDASIAYKIKNGTSVMGLNDTLSFEEDGNVDLTFEKIAEDQVFAGEYKGTVTFTVSYENINN